MFHQIEGLVIDEATHLGHLKWVLEEFCKAFFEVREVKMRFRASHFPFTEPSMEVDIGYAEVGDEIRIGEGDQWLEILGCGMVHPNVLKNVGLDPARYQGFAFGMGIDRIAMLKYGMPDLRAFFAGDLRWLSHYGFPPLAMPHPCRGTVVSNWHCQSGESRNPNSPSRILSIPDPGFRWDDGAWLRGTSLPSLPHKGRGVYATWSSQGSDASSSSEVRS